MTGWQPDVPYNELPPPPSAYELESRAVLKAAVEANAAVARLDQAAFSTPNPTVLINAIPLLEARASSEIENIVTTTDALFQHADDGGSANAETRETLRYRSALRTGFEAANHRGLSASAAANICSTIKGHEIEIRSMPGTRIANPVTKEVIYSPPEGADVIAAKLSDWERFVHSGGIIPLIRMAAAHYQFEAIHPFPDGNGRTGRILNVLMLVHAGLLRLPILYLSRHFIETKDEYYERLLAVTAKDEWEQWLLYVLDGVTTTSQTTLHLISSIRELQEDFRRRAKDVTHAAHNYEFQSLLFEQPYCRIALVMDRCGVSRPTATNWLNALGDAGLLEDVRVGRERIFINREFLRLLAEHQ